MRFNVFDSNYHLGDIARNEMEGEPTERKLQIQIHLTEPQGKLKK